MRINRSLFIIAICSSLCSVKIPENTGMQSAALYSLCGKKIFEIDASSSQINFTGLPSNVYVLKLELKTGIRTKMVAITKN